MEQSRHLHLDMPGLGHEAFQVDGVVAEARLGLGPHQIQRTQELPRLADQPDAAPATARRCLDHQRETDSFGRGQLVCREWTV
jgi:hypothetical protein